MSRRDLLWFYALGVEMAAAETPSSCAGIWVLSSFRGNVSSREPVGVAGVAVGFSLPPETCLQFLHLCSETRALPEQHGRNPVREVPAHFPEMKGLRRKIFPQFISRPCDLL